MYQSNIQGKHLTHQRVWVTTRAKGNRIYSPQKTGKTRTGRNNSADAFLSVCRVDNEGEVDFKSPDYFKSMESEDPDLYHAIIESLRVATGDPDYHPHYSDMEVNIFDMAKPAKAKKRAQAAKADKVTQPGIQHSYQTLEDVPEEEFEIWEDDVFERSMSDSEDDWEEILDERVDALRTSYSTAIPGNDNNG